jgi:hypothetical protein
LDVITAHRLGMLGLSPEHVGRLPLSDRVARTYEAFLERVPFENLSNQRVCTDDPEHPEHWPRTTDRFLRENRASGLGGTSFTLAYALRDLLRGVGANAHCALGKNLVTEEAHATVIVYFDDGPYLYDAALLCSGPIPVYPGGTLRDPLGTVHLEARDGPTLTLCLKVNGTCDDRQVYSLVPVPAPPQAFRQAWVASFYRGQPRPLRLARRVNGEIRRYGEPPRMLEVITCRGREQRVLDEAPVDDLHDLFGIDRECLASWFAGQGRVVS